MGERASVLIVGTGFSGLGLGIRLKQSDVDDFVILERADDLGGTWRDNHCPACACDVQSNLYSFSFAPKPSWSRRFAPQPETWADLRQCAGRHNILPHIHDNANVVNARFDASTSTWVATRPAAAPSGARRAPCHPRVPARHQRVQGGRSRGRGRAMGSATLAS